ncbi:hypothetical protein E1285_01920 [Actinomadura sp. 7K507]|nr:hypothetical protein E1285_01920 [Actinomadura sp. 7K507]
MRSQLVVIAPGMAEVVRYAGGWLFDRGMAGWDVVVLTPDRGDPRPLRILGAHAADLECALASPVRGRRPQALSVCAGLYAADERVRRMVIEALDGGRVEVTLWGDPWPAELDPVAAPVPHRLSVAARAFKARAMGAAACPLGGGCEPTEMFRRGEFVRTLGNV